MDDKTLSEAPARWLGLPVIATVARILCRELTLQNEYLRLENLRWREFLSRRAKGFICAGLLTKEIRTLKGLQTAFVFFVPHLQARRILVARATFSPNGHG